MTQENGRGHADDRYADDGHADDGYADGRYDEALERLHRTGPEFDGWLSNHGPMVVEALARRGSSGSVHAWTDRYITRLEELPAAREPITDATWRQALGRAERLGDWLAYFAERLDRTDRDGGSGWREVLATWWPRLLPGLAAGATHGVIRTGHAVLALQAGTTGPRVTELAQALGYWAARWQPVPVVPPRGTEPAAHLVRTVPRVPRQEGGIRERLAHLDGAAGWPGHVARLAPPADDGGVPQVLAGVVDAVVAAYPRLAHGNPTMLVHAATAPNAVLRALPCLPRELWRPSLDAAWSASAAVLAAYRPSTPADDEAGPGGGAGHGEDAGDEAWERAVADGGEHVVKLADTARDTARRADPAAAARAVATAVALRA